MTLSWSAITPTHGAVVPEPTDVHRPFALRDGSVVELRPLLPTDELAYREFTSALSAESQYYRFFSRRSQLTEAEIDRFVHVDHVERVALIAVRGDEIVAIGRYDAEPDRSEAEVAFIVRDDLHGNGVGPALLDLLAEVASRHGIDHFTASVLPDNHKMLRVFEKSGRLRARRFLDGAIRLELTVEPVER